MKPVLFSILFLLLFQFKGHSQVRTPENLKLLRPDEIANYYINSLKKGVLLVRLSTKQKKIDILNRNNRQAEARLVKQEQDSINRSIIKAFKTHFTFCPTYFFYSHDSKHILNRNIDSIQFLSEDLSVHPFLEINTPHFLVAEFTRIAEDTALNRDQYYYTNGENGVEQKVKYSGGTNMDFGALIIKSPELVQLSAPFPYYARTLSSLPIFRKSHRRVVQDMNKKLSLFYENAHGTTKQP